MVAGDNVRDAIVRTADRMFTESGVEEVSMRAVAAESGQRNISAIQYHFGGREGLFDAVFHRRSMGLSERRGEYLAQIDGAGRGEDVRALIEAAVLPLAEHVRDASVGSDYARFAARMTRGVDFATCGPDLVGEASYEILVRLTRVLASLSAEDAALRVGMVMNMMVAVLAAYEERCERDATARASGYFETMTSHLIDMLAGAMEAPVRDVG